MCEDKNSYWIVKNFRIQTRKEYDMPNAFIHRLCNCAKCLKKFGNKSEIKFKKGVLEDLRKLDPTHTNFSLYTNKVKTFAIKSADVVIFLSDNYIPDSDNNIISLLFDKFKECKIHIKLGTMLICHGGASNIDDEKDKLNEWLNDSCNKKIELGYLGQKLEPLEDPCPIQSIECITCKSIQQLTNINIYSARNQSVSVAHANCIEFLNKLPGSNTNLGGRIHEEGMRPDSKFNINNSNNIEQLDEWDDGTLVGLLDSENYMNRQDPLEMCNREENGDGISINEMVCGIVEFFKERDCNFDINKCIQYAGIYHINDKDCFDFIKCDLDWEWLCNMIDCGYAVYGSYSRYTGDDLKVRVDGQAFRIVGVRKCKNRKWITTLDDRDQSNDCDGLRIKEWDVSELVNCQGNLNGLMKLDGSNRILTFALAYKLNKQTYLIGCISNLRDINTCKKIEK
jgi:hypothetical protein